MDPKRRPAFNAWFTEERFGRYLASLESRLGKIPFRVAETPLFVTPALRDHLVRCAVEIVAQASAPALLEKLGAAIPDRFRVPRMDELPNTAQVDFALVRSADGGLEGKLIEMQGFPSLYALMPMMADAWTEALRGVSGLDEKWTCLFGPPGSALDLVKRTILGGCQPEEVVLVDIEPEKQKTSPDFWATKQLFGVDSVCITKLLVEGRRVSRLKDGKRVPVRRIYNRVVFDELDKAGVKAPFAWGDDLDVTWCSHPNWYWAWSKYTVPHLSHPAIPKARLLSDIDELPEDLSRYVLKPLFSFAGGGVLVDVTREAVEAVPQDKRGQWMLQEKIDYAPAITMPDGNGVKAEVRIMVARPPGQAKMQPAVMLVRMSRGKMLGVDFNKNLTWVGGSVGIWPEGS